MDSIEYKTKLGSSNQNIINWDVDQLDEISYETHHCESNSDCSAYLPKLFLGGFCTTCQELIPFTNKLLRDLEEFFNFVGH